MSASNNKKELQAFLGIIYKIGKFSPDTADVGDPLHKLISSKVIWTWNASYQALFNKEKLLIKSDMCMRFYDDIKLLYLETNTSRVGLDAALLQTHEGTSGQKDMVPNNIMLCPIVFASKSLTGTECRYSNIEREALGILHGLEKFHHYCFAREVHIITDHKPWVAIFKNDVAMLLQCIQCILLKIHQYRVQLYLLQTGCCCTTMKKAKMSPSETWI